MIPRRSEGPYFSYPSFGGFGFIGVATDLSIVAGWQITSQLPMSPLGHKRPFSVIVVQCPLWSGKRTFQIGQFCENLGDIPTCPLFSKADVRAPQKPLKLGSAFGHKRTWTIPSGLLAFSYILTGENPGKN